MALSGRPPTVVSLKGRCGQHPAGRCTFRLSKSIFCVISDQRADIHTDLEQKQCDNKLLALKEWSLTVQALHTGQQQVLLRKGGLREPFFQPSAKLFPLFPTGFHSDTELLKPNTATVYCDDVNWDPKLADIIPVKCVAQVDRAYTTKDTNILQILDDFHIWGAGFAEKRLKWRAQQPITVMLLRVWNFEQPMYVRQDESLWGCFSWVDLSCHLASGAVPAIDGPAIQEQAWAGIHLAFSDKMKAVDSTELLL